MLHTGTTVRYGQWKSCTTLIAIKSGGGNICAALSNSYFHSYQHNKASLASCMWKTLAGAINTVKTMFLLGMYAPGTN